MNDHDCRPSDHMTCRKCGKDVCLALYSDHRAAMYRLRGLCFECRDKGHE